MNRKEKQIEKCGCISVTTINTLLTTIRVRMLSLDPRLMWKTKKRYQKNLKVINVHENKALK